MRSISSCCLAVLFTGAALLAQTAPQHEKNAPRETSVTEYESTLALPAAARDQLSAEIIPSDAMSAEDKELAAAAEPQIRARSAMEAMQWQQAGWRMEQIVCPSFPHSLLLRYSQSDADRSRSMFSAVIPRHAGESGGVRIVPIVRRGYSLFSPAPVNAMTIGAMNAMMARETSHPALADIAVCYSALTGAAVEGAPDGRWFVRLAEPPTVLAEVGGGESVFVTTAGMPPQQWELDFGHHGHLMHAAHSAGGAQILHIAQHANEEPAWKPAPRDK